MGVDILRGVPPHGLRRGVEVAHQLTASVVTDRAVPDETCRAAIDTFGEAGVTAILWLIGQYQTISSILVCFQVPVPPQPPGHRGRTTTPTGPGTTEREPG